MSKEKKIKTVSKKKEAKGTNVAVFQNTGIVPHTGNEPDAKLRSAVLKAREAIDTGRWNLAEALFKIYDTGVWANWGYPTWESYVENEVGVTTRTAQYLTKMYNYFTIELLSEVQDCDKSDPKLIEAVEKRDEIIEKIKPLGWTKAKSLVGVIKMNNADEWIEKAATLSSSELESMAKNVLNKEKGKTVDETEIARILSFKLFPEQLEITENGLELAGNISGSDKRGNQLALIMQDFIASNMAQKESGQKKSGSYFNKVGVQFGVRFIAVSKETGQIIHNKELFDKLAESVKDADTDMATEE